VYLQPEEASEGDAMERELKTKEELLEILDEKIKKAEGCEGYRIEAVELAGPNSEGCNWSGLVFEVKSSREPPIEIPPLDRDARIDKIVEEARKKYNLKFR
jgi:hypothetical protein